MGIGFVGNRSFGFGSGEPKLNFETEDRTQERWKTGVATQEARKKVFMLNHYFDLFVF